jgi:hypothetical protein
MSVCDDYNGGEGTVDCSNAKTDNKQTEKIPQPGDLGMTLIIRDQLVNPPTWFSSFRDLTLYCSVFLKDDIVIESDDPDPYYRWMRPRGGMDFVEDFVRPGAEDGVHLDLEHNYPRTVVTDRIAPENVHSLIRLILFCRGAA